MRIKYMKDIVNMLDNEWDLGKVSSHAKGKVCAWIYLFEIIEEAEQIVLKKENNKVIGICAYTKWNSKKHLFRKKFYRYLKNTLINSPLIKNKQAMYKYNDDYAYLPEKFKNHFDGEISILIVDKKYRGNNYGKELLLKTFELARNDDMKNLYILTDESCNFGFYENIGCKKIYEKIISNGDDDECGTVTSEMGYIYEKTL